MPSTPARRPPSVDRLTRVLASRSELAEVPTPLLADAVRSAIRATPEDPEGAAIASASALAIGLRTSVINATGVLLHTNLGRTPVAAHGAVTSVRYANLELDMVTGRRGSRQALVAPLLGKLTGAEDALVVNNGAAALLLALSATARGRAVVVSRGELVEIGGGFRVPEIIEAAGIELVEVGTTNRTRISDYRRAISARTDVAAVLKVHTSNYSMQGFVSSVDVRELATLGLAVIADIGSGLLDARTPWLADASGRVPTLSWLTAEPAVRQTLADGATAVVFSGDKLLGGPQAGIIAGSASLLATLAAQPLMRALRPGSLVIERLHATLLAHLRRDLAALPFWTMALAPLENLRLRAENIAAAVDASWCTVAPCESVPGGGTLPGVQLPSYGVRLAGNRTTSLRTHTIPVIARAAHGATWLDLRTVDPADDAALVAAVAGSVSGGAPSDHEPLESDTR